MPRPRIAAKLVLESGEALEIVRRSEIMASGVDDMKL